MMNVLVNNKFLKSSLIIIAFLLLCAFLYFNDPINSSHTPKCWFKVFTGLSCPGCGFQRCVHALLHGNILEAINYNLFLVIGVPYLVFVAVSESLGLKYSMMLIKRRAAYLYIFLYFIWFAVRNVYNI